MANWHYYNDKRERIGPVTGKELKQLAQQGIITPETFIEDPTGRTGLAKDVKGLKFADTSSVLENSSTIAVPLPPNQPIPVPSPAPKQFFCTNCGNAISEQAVACMSCGAKPIGHKKFCRQCGVAINSNQVVCVQCGANITGISLDAMFGIDKMFGTDKIKILNICFTVFCMSMATSALASAVILVVGGIGSITGTRVSMDTVRSILYFLTYPTRIYQCGILVGMISGCMLLYQLWKLIPADIARTTPEKAIGFLFIPIFQFYWAFVTFWGLSKDMNHMFLRRSTQCQVSEGLGLAFCVLFIPTLCLLYFTFGWDISFVSPLTLPFIIIAIFFFRSVRNGAFALLEQEGE